MRKLFILGFIAVFIAVGFSYGKEDVNDPTVYVKEKGKTYHKRNCKLVKQGKTGIKLSEALARGLKPCKVCKPPAPVGPTVYIKKDGKKYHKKDCTHVKKDRIAISLDQALKKGFTPCAVCKPPVKIPAKKKKT